MRFCFRKRSSNFYHANERFLRLLLSPPLDKAHLAAPPLSSTADNAGENVLVQVKAQLKVHPDGAGAEKDVALAAAAAEARAPPSLPTPHTTCAPPLRRSPRTGMHGVRWPRARLQDARADPRWPKICFDAVVCRRCLAPRWCWRPRGRASLPHCSHAAIMGGWSHRVLPWPRLVFERQIDLKNEKSTGGEPLLRDTIAGLPRICTALHYFS